MSDRAEYENDSTKDDVAGDACIDQPGLVERGSGVAAGYPETDSSFELLRRRATGGHQEDTGGTVGEARRGADVT